MPREYHSYQTWQEYTNATGRYYTEDYVDDLEPSLRRQYSGIGEGVRMVENFLLVGGTLNELIEQRLHQVANPWPDRRTVWCESFHNRLLAMLDRSPGVSPNANELRVFWAALDMAVPSRHPHGCITSYISRYTTPVLRRALSGDCSVERIARIRSRIINQQPLEIDWPMINILRAMRKLREGNRNMNIVLAGMEQSISNYPRDFYDRMQGGEIAITHHGKTCLQRNMGINPSGSDYSYLDANHLRWREFYDKVLAPRVYCFDCDNRINECTCEAGGGLRCSHPLKFSGGEPTRNSCYVPRFVGLEFEICGFGKNISQGGATFGKLLSRTTDDCTNIGSELISFMEHWGGDIKGDGSLPHGGRELVMAPVRKSAALKALRKFTSLLDKSEAWVDGRAGGHVHVDVRDLSRDQINAVYSIWYILQDVVVDKMARGRLSGPYCRRLEPRDTVIEPDLLTHDEYYGSRHDRLFTNGRERYVTLNRQSISAHNTLEFRLFPGTVSYRRALANASVASKIVHFAQNVHRSELKKCIKMTPEELFKYVVGSRTAKLVDKLPRNEYLETSREKITYDLCGGHA